MSKRVNIVCAGRIKERYLKDGIAEYEKRLGRFCDFSIVEVADFPDSATSAAAESALILPKLQSSFVILTDINGEQVTSEQLGAIIDKAYSDGFNTVSFVIGGSNGVAQSVKSAAHKAISFGRVTYPHKLMRLILTEQIYRAFTITAGMPYHK